jgi:hypothetical protein
MQHSELLSFSNSVVEANDTEIILTYDLGDGDDTQRFQAKVERLANNFSNFDITIEILPDQSDEEEWNIANILIIHNGDSIEDIKSFIVDIDTI